MNAAAISNTTIMLMHPGGEAAQIGRSRTDFDRMLSNHNAIKPQIIPIPMNVHAKNDMMTSTIDILSYRI